MAENTKFHGFQDSKNAFSKTFQVQYLQVQQLCNNVIDI